MKKLLKEYIQGGIDMCIEKDEFGNIIIGKEKTFAEMTEKEQNEYIKELDKQIKELTDY